MERKVIAVIGATGAQGGGVVRAILADPDGGFSARAVVRDPSSEKARELAKLGAEVVAGDVDDVASLEKAFAGAWGAYCVTFYWAHMSPEKEKEQAHNMARAAKAAGLHHVVWSTLEDSRNYIPLSDDRMPTLMEHYKVPHFDAKGEADHFFTDLGVPTTFLLTSFYWDNLIGFGMGPKRGEDGKLTFMLPIGNARMSGISADDIGRCAYGIFRKGTSTVGQRIGIAGEHISGAQMAETLGRHMGEEVRFQSIEPEVYRGFGFPGADDLGNMFQFYRDFEEPFIRIRDVEKAKSLNPQLQNFDTWVRANAARIPKG